MTEEVRVG